MTPPPLVAVLAIALLALVALCVALFAQVNHVRRAAAESALLGHGAMQALHAELRVLAQAVSASQAEARLQGESQKAASHQIWAGHVGSLHGQLHEVVSATSKQLGEGQKSTHEALERFNEQLQAQLGRQQAVMMGVQGQLGALGEAAKGMHALGRDLVGLQNILRAPKLRGNLGELLLAEVLRQVLPADAFRLQHRFEATPEGDSEGGPVIVDAVILLGERMVPIDAKFPLESFTRLLDERESAEVVGTAQAGLDVKHRRAFHDVLRRHIDAVADKYIRPEEGTYDFALAYIPAENVYYEAVVRGQAGDQLSLSGYAAKRRVMIVSPATLYAYLLTVLYGLRGLRIEQKAEHIRKDLGSVQKKFAAFFCALEKSHKHLSLSCRSHEDAMRRARKLNDQLGQITGDAYELAPLDEAASSPEPLPVASKA